MTKAQELFLIN
jgi:hypothetical protein